MPKEIEFSELGTATKEIDYGDLQQPPSNYAPVFLEAGGRRVIDALNPLNWPGYAGDVLGQGVAGAAALAQRPFSDQSLGDLYRGELQKFPARAMIEGGPHVDTFDLQAAAKTFPEALRRTVGNMTMGDTLMQAQIDLMRSQAMEGQPSIPELFRENREESVDAALDRFETNPSAMAHGQLFGDAASLAAIRSPTVALRRRAMQRAEAAPPPPPMDPGMKRFLDRKVGDFARGLKKGGLQISETGLEGAYLAAVNDEDPMSAAGWAAGTQAFANFTRMPWDMLPNVAKKHPTASTGIKIGVLAASMAGFAQIAKSLTPGGKDYILESSEFGFDKVAMLIGLSFAANLAGFSRPHKATYDDLSFIADIPSSMKRGAVLSLMSDMSTDEKGLMEPVRNQMQEDMGRVLRSEELFFAPHEQRRLLRAMTSEDISLQDTIDDLMETDRNFRMKMNSLLEGQ